MKFVAQAVLAIFIITKIVLSSVFIYQAKFGPLNMGKEAMASEPDRPVQKAGTDNTPKESKADQATLFKREAELEQKQKALMKTKAELKTIQAEINAKIEKLTQLRNEIRTEMANKKVAEEDKLKHLIKVYSSMKPQNAASLIEKLDTGFAIKLLSQMKGDVVGSILSFVSVEKAAKISEGLADKSR